MSRYSKDDIIRMVHEDDVEFIRMQFTDIFGQLKNVAITASQIEKAVNNEIMIDGSSIEGFVRIQESDQYLRPDLDTFTVLIDGCDQALRIDLRSYARRPVSNPRNETVVVGPHDAFNETLRDNLTLLHRRLPSPNFVCQLRKVGTETPGQAALCYLDGVCPAETVEELQRRLDGVELDYVLTSGTVSTFCITCSAALRPASTSGLFIMGRRICCAICLPSERPSTYRRAQSCPSALKRLTTTSSFTSRWSRS